MLWGACACVEQESVMLGHCTWLEQKGAQVGVVLGQNPVPANKRGSCIGS